jgi:tRNA-specific adenosine deaminase 3
LPESENIQIINLPFIQPVSKEQTDFCKSKWPIFLTPSIYTKIIYSHSKQEIFNLSKIISVLNQENLSCLLFQPKENLILSKIKISENSNNPINHSIMRMIRNFSADFLLQPQIIQEESQMNNTMLGNKRPSPYISYLDYSNQYYLEDLYIFTFSEPCFMCAMAVTHSRIARVYFLKDNLTDGALCSKMKINNYSLNHNYLIFKIE